MSELLSSWQCKPKWDENCMNLLKITSDKTNSKPKQTKFITLLELSSKFPIEFPIETIKCSTLQSSVAKNILERNIQSTYPLIHENALYFCTKFLLHKLKFGSEIEKQLYKGMNLIDFIDRLLLKRAVMFMGRFDSYILLNGTKGTGKQWNTIGTNNEKNPLILKDCLSYDEIKLSALLSVSSYNYFINDGNRKNKGIVTKNRLNLQEDGIVIGLIGARLRKPDVMEYQEIVVNNNEKENLAKLFTNLYEEPFKLYNEIEKNNDRYVLFNNNLYFDNVLYTKRLILSFDTFLIEANARACTIKKYAYLHLVGIGLGVWRIADHQEQVFVDTFIKRVHILGPKLSNISDVHFAYFSSTKSLDKYKLSAGNKLMIKEHPLSGIQLHLSKREPFSKIAKDKLLVVSYAWDGNALPGNEFWKGMLGSTGDSATASSCQISELHNPHINPMVCGTNTRIVTPDGLIPIKEYCDRICNNNSKLN